MSSAANPRYTIERIETHCYLLLLDRVPVGRLERRRGMAKRGRSWEARLGGVKIRPPPFEADTHFFPSFAAASSWLGLPF